MSELQHPIIKTEPPVANDNSINDTTSKKLFFSKIFVADLNARPPECDGGDCTLAATPRSARGPLDQELCHTRFKSEFPLESGPDTEADQQCQVVSTSREDKVTSLKAVLHVHRAWFALLGRCPKMPMRTSFLVLCIRGWANSTRQLEHLKGHLRSCYNLRMGLPDRSCSLLFKFTMHRLLAWHKLCILLGNSADGSDKELESAELDDVLTKLRDSVQSDVRQATVWNTLGLILLRTGRLQSAISVLSLLLALAPDHLDALANLGLAYLQSGNLARCAQCFQDLILKDQNHPAALTNYAAFLLCKFGSIVAGPGADADEGSYTSRIVAANVAKECLVAAAKADPKSGYIWVNLANAYHLAGDHKNAGKCLEKAARLEPNRMSTRYAVALYRTKEAERSQNPAEQLNWAANEMASILREGDPSIVEPRTSWAGLAIAYRAQHEIASAFDDGQKDLKEVEERAVCTLKKAIEENPDDSVQWNQLGLYNLCTLQFKASQKYLKAAVACSNNSCYSLSNLGISLQLSEDELMAEKAYKRALSLATDQEAHAILSNLGNLYRQQRQFDQAKVMFAKSFEICPGYAPAHNNLGLVLAAEGRWEDAKNCFAKALQVDPLLDAAKSNMMKAVAMFRMCVTTETSQLENK